MLAGRGRGGLILTVLTGTPRPRSAASCRAFLRSANRAISPLITSCGPTWGMSLTTDDTSTTVSPFSTPSLNSSKKRSFMETSSLGCERSFPEQDELLAVHASFNRQAVERRERCLRHALGRDQVGRAGRALERAVLGQRDDRVVGIVVEHDVRAVDRVCGRAGRAQLAHDVVNGRQLLALPRLVSLADRQRDHDQAE